MTIGKLAINWYEKGQEGISKLSFLGKVFAMYLLRNQTVTVECPVWDDSNLPEGWDSKDLPLDWEGECSEETKQVSLENYWRYCILAEWYIITAQDSMITPEEKRNLMHIMHLRDQILYDQKSKTISLIELGDIFEEFDNEFEHKDLPYSSTDELTPLNTKLPTALLEQILGKGWDAIVTREFNRLIDSVK